jgi:uncharacterized repeat protein (TIGR03803 family)
MRISRLVFLLCALVPASLFSQSIAGAGGSDVSVTPQFVREVFEFVRGSGGFNPDGALILDQAGNFYGTTREGGNDGCGGVGCGTVFELSHDRTAGWIHTVLYAFSGGADGAAPCSKLTFDSQGNLYGTAWGGGMTSCSGGCGTVFMLTPNGGSWTETTLYDFRGGSDGFFPKANLVLDKAGNVYGTTQSGGVFLNWGTLFKLTRGQDGEWSESIVKSFNDDADGCIPLGITKDAQDNIYGINTSCGLGLDYGTVWEVTNAGVYSRVHQFSATGEEGTYPSVGLTIDDAGNLYGATQAGGNQNLCSYEGCGVLYKMTLTANGWEETVLYQFSDEPGDAPNGDLTFDAKGNLFGTTVYNFNNNYGTLFELSQTPDGPVFNTIVVFSDIFGPPSAGVVFDSNGRAYGTQSYGRIGYGAVYEFAP